MAPCSLFGVQSSGVLVAPTICSVVPERVETLAGEGAIRLVCVSRHAGLLLIRFLVLHLPNISLAHIPTTWWVGGVGEVHS
jgi:hypothetical protein